MCASCASNGLRRDRRCVLRSRGLDPEQGKRGGQDPHARLGQVAARPDSGRVAGAYPFGQRLFDEFGSGASVGSPAGSTAERKSPHAVERDSELNRIRRAEFHQHILSIDPKKLAFLDESGISTTMTRRFALCLGGARIHEGTPEGDWQIPVTSACWANKGEGGTGDTQINRSCWLARQSAQREHQQHSEAK
jgi:hypothetical protein